VWSYILDYENAFNPFEERKNIIEKWKSKAILDIEENEHILQYAKELVSLGLKSKDALHVACAIEGKCDYFLTTDDKVLNKLKNYNKIEVVNPINVIANFND